MSTRMPHQVVEQVITAFDRGDWTIFDAHPGLAEIKGLSLYCR